jgi:glycosyltransferase involved in cell wall biosynthesis
MGPKISIIIRSYNSEQYIRSALDSALNQTLSNKYYELLIIDDGSDDGTKKILLEYKKNHTKRIRIICEKHKGPTYALNLGIKNALGDYIIILDSDDEFEPNILEKMWSIHNNYNIDFVYSDYYEKSVDGEKTEYISVKEDLFSTLAAGIMFKKKDLINFGLYDEKFKLLSSYDMMMKYKVNNLKGHHIEEALYTYNRREGSVTSDKEALEEAMGKLKKKWGKDFIIRDY